ncbi:reticulon-1 isoform X2 [Teleopsis dalmanni]|uniref:reticulon-1 isoform X2 n=1 Tax=Teleopsis dalmanni TaxID=139649 RepID=UPI0018CEA289|nr:reticulon-1 isoform X2 [Teleopsis dalmanni]
MDFNFADLKKEAAATGEDIFTHVTDVGKKAATSVVSAAQNLIDDVSTEPHDNNLHSAAMKDFDFEHVDPQTFVQRMSAGAKEAQEELDAKFAQKTQDLDFLQDTHDIGAQIQQDGRQGMAAMTHDFMNAERNFFDTHVLKGDVLKPAPVAPVSAPAPAPAPAPAVNKYVVPEDDLFNIGNVPTAPLAPMTNYYDEPIIASVNKSADIAQTNKDSDTDSPSISYNPSPAKKHPVADALKEQENEKFISSEDLLSDFKEERNPTPDFHAAPTVGVPTFASSGINDFTNKVSSFGIVPTTDLDEDNDVEIIAKGTYKAEDDSSKFDAGKQVFDTKSTFIPETKPKIETITAPAPVPAPTPITVKAESSSVPIKPQPTEATAKKVPTTFEQDTKGLQPKIISVEEIFYKYGLVESLIYWRDVKKSGIVFGAGLVTLLAISCFSVISVFAYLSLILLGGTVAFRMYKSVMQAIQKTSEGHPFKEYLDIDLTLSQDKVQNIAGVAVAHLNGFTAELRRLFLVEDLVDSIKFGVILWVMTYIGAWFNGMTLVILAFVTLFTLPKVYENNKQSIDAYLDLVRSKLTEVTDKIKVAIPIVNKKPIAAETDKDK